MKKAISLILAVLIIFSSITGSFTAFAATELTPEQISDYFENPDNWTLYNSGAQSLSQTDLILEKATNSWPDIQNKSNYVLEGDQSLYMRSRTKYSAIYLPSNLKANTDYLLSFSYYTTALYGDLEYAFNPLSLSTTDIENAGFFYGKSGVLNYWADNVSYTSTDGTTKENTKYHPANGTSPLVTTAGEWHKVTLEFNTADFSEFALVLKSQVEYLYLDDFSLEEKPIDIGEYFENPDNWMLYSTSATALSQTNYVLAKSADGYPDIQNKTSYVLEGDKSLYMRSRLKYSAIYLPSNLKADTNYVLSFSYYTDALHADGLECAFNPLSLYTTDVENAGFFYGNAGVLNYWADNVSYTSTDGITKKNTKYHPANGTSPLVTTAGEWHKVTLEFNTASFKEFALVLESRVEFLYLDDFSLAEKIVPPEEYFATPDNWTLYDQLVETLTTPSTATWTSVTNTTVTVGTETTNALKVHALNHRVTSYLPNLKKNTEYIFSFKYYAESLSSAGYIFQDMVLFNPDYPDAKIAWSTDTANGVKEFVSYNGYYIWNTDYSKATTYWDDSHKTISAKAGEWNTYTITFNTGDYDRYAIVLRQKVEDIYLSDFTLLDTSEIPEEEVELNFEDASQWERYSSGSINTSSGQAQNTWHVISENTTDANYIKEGDTSIKITPQSQFNMIKLGGLEPDTKYMLKFSYITDSMQNTEGTARSTLLNSCGIWNYDSEDANFTVSHTTYRGYLHASKMSGDYFEICFESKNSYVLDYFTRKVSNQQANVWYDKILFFDSAKLNDALAFVVSLNVGTVYLDDFMLVALDESEPEAEYSAPALSGKTAVGTYESYKTNTTLYNEVTATDYEGYLTTLATEGFAEYATNAYGENKFAIYTKGNVTVNVTYNPYNSTMLVAEQVTNALPTRAEENVYTDKGYEPAFIQIDHNTKTNGGTGMSYVVRLADGSFIVIDGGMPAAHENATLIYDTMKKYSNEEKPVIAAWLLTHAHEDHIAALTSFIEKYYNDATIEQVVLSFPTLEQCRATGGALDYKMTYESVPPLYLSLQALMPDTKISTCHSGYKYNIRNAVVDVMFTLEDLFPKVYGVDNMGGHNGLCTIFKISFEDADQSLLVTGDINGAECTEMLKKYAGDELKATFVQAVHHGISFGGPIDEMYSKIQPEVVLLPTSSAIAMANLYQEQNQYLVTQDSVKEIAISDYGTRAFVLPYTAPEGLTGLGKFTLPADIDMTNTLNTYVGTSIRQAGENGDAKQALRFKFQIPEHIIRAHTEDGYSVAEYGMMVSENSANLNYYEGNKAYTTVDGTKVFKGVAYNKETNKNVVFDYVNYANLDDGESRSTQYTCALYNIGVLSDDTTDYTKYDTTIYVRSYIIFKNANGDTKVYYGDTQSASVFAVMQTILTSTATDDQTVSDQTYVKNFLDGKVEGFTADATAISEAWLSDSTRATIYTPVN